MQEKLNWYVVFSVPSVTGFYLNSKPHCVCLYFCLICLFGRWLCQWSTCTQVRRSRFRARHPCQKLGLGAHTCNSSTRRWKQGSLNLLILCLEESVGTRPPETKVVSRAAISSADLCSSHTAQTLGATSMTVYITHTNIFFFIVSISVAGVWSGWLQTWLSLWVLRNISMRILSVCGKNIMI